MKRTNRYRAHEWGAPPRPVRPAWQRAIELATWLLLLPLAAALLYLVAGEFGAVPRVPGVPERPTAHIVAPSVAAPAPRSGAEGAGAVSQPAEPATAPLVKPAPKGKAEPTPEPKATPGGKDAQAAPLEVAAAEVVKPTPGGKTTKVREGKGTP